MCSWQCFVGKVYYNRKVSNDSPTYFYMPIIRLPPLAFVFIEIIDSIFSALSFFQTVRRRTMVWINPPSKKDRKISLIETDCRTLIGQIRSGLAGKKNNWISGRIKKKITRALRRFESSSFSDKLMDMQYSRCASL